MIWGPFRTFCCSANPPFQLLGSIRVALSLIASHISAIKILGVPAEIYIYGTQYWLIIASYVILFPSVALVFVPVFRAVDISSSYEVS